MALALALLASSSSVAKVKAVSTDGEATVYLNGDFSHDFDLAYEVLFGQAPRNRSWSTLSILLLGGGGRSGSINVGLIRGYPNAATLSAFVISTPPGQKGRYQNIPVTCVEHCTLRLKGDKSSFTAFVQDRPIGSWTRRSLHISKPYVQLNGEVSGLKDTLFATIVPLRMRAGDENLHPTCAFTTQGIEARLVGSRGEIRMSGTRRVDARVTYVSLRSGKTGDKCPVN